MTKKGGIQQLQAEIYNDDDLDKFLEKDGILGREIYFEESKVFKFVPYSPRCIFGMGWSLRWHGWIFEESEARNRRRFLAFSNLQIRLNCEVDQIQKS